MAKQRVPQKLQGILWSVNVDQLDLEENSSYIVNQILSLGTLEELRWLFKTYGKDHLREVFVNQPAKIYSPSAFAFSKNILLDLEKRALPPNKYVQSLPRDTR